MTAPASRPNVLFICTDQQRADHNGFMGNQIVRTPHLDTLAARGTVFDNAWVANPVCMPNRSTMMTGRLPTAHGVVFNDRSLDPNVNTYVRVLRAAGYRTALIGKSHLQHGMSRDSMNPNELAPVQLPSLPDGWDTVEDQERYLNGFDDPEDFYGFGHIELSIDHGARVSGHHLQWALDKGATMEDLQGLQVPDAPGRRRSDRWWQVYEPPYEAEVHSTEFVTDRTIAFIEEEAAEPWMVMASFPDPHHPMTPPGEWFDRHDPADMEVSPTIDDSLPNAPDYLRQVQKLHPSKQRFWVQPCGVAGDHDMVREATAATYGMVEMIDDGIGRIMAALEQTGQTDNTIVVFTSDHGDMMGDHGLMLKGFMHFRGTLQVPMVVVAPGQSAQRSSSLASTLDLAPTLIDLCGLEPYYGIQGRSLRPVVEDGADSVREVALIEDDLPASEYMPRNPVPTKTRTILTADGLKYTRNSDGGEMLYDLAADPEEREDLQRADKARKAEMVERMMDALIEADDVAKGGPATPPRAV